jgi:hypothetical protein
MRALQIVWDFQTDLGLIPDEENIHVERLSPDVYGSCGCYSSDPPDTRRIFIDPDSPLFALARRGDLQPLACLLTHEQAHVVHGKNEAIAYQVTLDFARVIGARKELLRSVEQALDRALHEQQQAAAFSNGHVSS